MESSSAPAMKTAAATTAMESTTATAAVKAAATTMEAATSTTTAVTAALGECGIGHESKNRESSERDEGSDLTKDAHNLTFPSSVVTGFQLQSLRMSLDPRVGKGRANHCHSRKPPL